MYLLKLLLSPRMLLLLFLCKFLLLGLGGYPFYKFLRGEFDAKTTVALIITNAIIFFLVVLVFVLYFYRKPSRPPNRQD